MTPHPIASRFQRFPILILALFAAVLLSGTSASQAATITWSGAGGDDLWSNPLNWTGGVLPTSHDDVVINVPGAVTVRMDAYNTRIRSLQCEESFLLESYYPPFRITAGPSAINGAFRQGPSSYGIEVQGPGTVLTLNGTVTNVAILGAVDGGVIALPTVRQLTADAAQLYAYGAGSAILMNEPDQPDHRPLLPL